MDAKVAPVQKTLLQLSLPLFLNSVLLVAVLMIDNMIISAHSADAAAAVNVANQVLALAFEFSLLLSVGGVIMISHSLGRGDEAQARHLAAVVIVSNAALGVFIGLALVTLGPLLIRWLNTPEAIADEARQYINIVALAMALHGFMVAGGACLRAFGRSRTVLMLGVFGSSFYLAAEYVLILGFGPIPPLGVVGSALGTLVMRVVAAIAVCVIVVSMLGVRLSVPETVRSWAIARRIIALSLPSVFENIAYRFYQLVLLGLVASFGVAAVLARAYWLIAVTFLTLTIMAISQGNEVLLGYHRGAGRTDAAYRQALRSSLAATVIASVFALLIYLGSDFFVGLFTKDPAVLALCRELLFLTIFLMPGYAYNVILFHSLRAVGDVRWPVVLSQGVTWGFALPLAWLLCVYWEWGILGIWYAQIAEEVVKGALMYLRWRGRTWHRHAIG